MEDLLYETLALEYNDKANVHVTQEYFLSCYDMELLQCGALDFEKASAGQKT